ncbi:von Willebrand factor [Plakobranchus ocellatus]|uniref:von Willebrand factor n=1 Tax=Plakobranchus ocellatus TaxID=259542 RepID=A0AAV4BJK1_9GAST|nr:von Willebrand factor [Plakobranchus ocellatus]
MGAESNGSVSLWGPKLIGIEAELTNDHRLWWTMELVDLTRIQHTVTLSPAMLSLITALGRKTKHSEAYGPKQAALKPSSNSIENYLMQGLQQAQMSNNRPPHMTIVEKEILALIKRFSAGTGRRNKEIALIMQGWNFKTFDGKNIHFAVPRRTSCTYLLGGDLRHSSFVLTYTKSGLSVSTKHSGIILHRDGSVSTTGRHDISLLPYTTEDNMLILESHNGHLHISVDHGKANISFSPHDDVFLVEMDRRLNNVSLGLLGTNNNEMGDDMRLPNGSLAQNSGSFQNSYELTGRGHCKVTTLPPPSMCQRFDISARSPCMSISNQWSQVIPCLLVLDPRPFLWQCQLFECQGKSGCPAVAAYLDTCRHHGIQVDEPPVCDGCRRTGDDVAFDLVIVHSLHWSLVPHHMLDWAVHFIKHLSLIQNNKSKLNIQIGLVTFGGSGEWEGSRSFLMQGK